MPFGVFELLESNSSLRQHPLEIVRTFSQSEVRRAFDLHFLPGLLCGVPRYRPKGCSTLIFKLLSFVEKENRLIISACSLCIYRVIHEVFPRLIVHIPRSISFKIPL
jgi:hypothetical protein